MTASSFNYLAPHQHTRTGLHASSPHLVGWFSSFPHFPVVQLCTFPSCKKNKTKQKIQNQNKKSFKKKKKKEISSTKVSDCSQVLQPRPFSKSRSGLSRPHYGSTGLNCIMCITGEVFSSIYSLISFI